MKFAPHLVRQGGQSGRRPGGRKTELLRDVNFPSVGGAAGEAGKDERASDGSPGVDKGEGREQNLLTPSGLRSGQGER